MSCLLFFKLTEISWFIALKWIHGAGWVHRDLSVGNLYLYEGRGLIGDFEYAKRKNTGVEDEELTVSSLLSPFLA